MNELIQFLSDLKPLIITGGLVFIVITIIVFILVLGIFYKGFKELSKDKDKFWL